ncbi:MAG: alkaline phosphatase [Xanthomonadales bacterium]
MRRRRVTAALLLAAVLLGGTATAPAAEHPETPRNAIFLLGDGMGFAQVKAYRMYADDPATELVEPLPMEAWQVGSVSTDSIRLDCSAGAGRCVRDPHGFTDSASSATAYATGHDTVVGHLSTAPDGATMPTVLEGARRAGKATGIVVTSQITHASPAAFGSHVLSRKDTRSIADQYFDARWDGAPMIDVLLGGGHADLCRGDRDLIPEFRAAGYDIVRDRESLLASRADRVLGLFAPQGLPLAWDRDAGVPSLADMTRHALGVLERDADGFFLMIEGSQIDWAAHANSVAGVISEMEDFIAAVRVALDFAAARGDTLVIVTADHETGGMTLGRDNVYRWDATPLRGLRRTPKAMAQDYVNGAEALSAIVARQFAFELDADEARRLDAAPRRLDPARAAIADLLNRRTFTGWTTTGHTGVDVPLYVFGPGRDRFHGVMQNEDVGQALRAAFLPEPNATP